MNPAKLPKHNLESMEDLMRDALGADRYHDLIARHRRLIAHLRKSVDAPTSGDKTK